MNQKSNVEVLIEYFTKYFPLDKKEKEELRVRFTERMIKRRGFVLQAGEVCEHFCFVVSGCLKMYAIDISGNEHNIQFSAENDWITDLDSFYSKQPTKVYIEAIERSTLLLIKYTDLLFLYTNYHKFDRNFRIIIEHKFIELQSRVLQTISSTAQERYESFLKQYPNLSSRLPSTQIASYLGITPEFLSKIRKQLVHKP